MSVQYMSAVCVVCVLLSLCLSDPCPCEDHTLCQPITTTPKKEVFVFSLTNTIEIWNKYNWSLTSTVVVVGNSRAPLMCLAHRNGARIVLLVDCSAAVLTNVTQRQIWLNTTVDMVKQHYYDGINVDYEGEISSSEKALRDSYTFLVEEITQTLRGFNKHAQVSVDVPHAPNVYNRYYDYSGLAKASDFLVVMDYDEWESPTVAGPNSPYILSFQGLVTYLKLPFVNTSKLVLAAPWYGYDYSCLHLFLNHTCLGDSEEKEAGLKVWRPQGYMKSNQQTRSLNFKDIIQLLVNSTSGRLWDATSMSPFFNYKNIKDGKLHQVWYDDPESLRIKYKLVSMLDLRGGGMWQVDALDYSDTPKAQKERKDMWNALAVFLL